MNANELFSSLKTVLTAKPPKMYDTRDSSRLLRAREADVQVGRQVGRHAGRQAGQPASPFPFHSWPRHHQLENSSPTELSGEGEVTRVSNCSDVTHPTGGS